MKTLDLATMVLIEYIPLQLLVAWMIPCFLVHQKFRIDYDAEGMSTFNLANIGTSFLFLVTSETLMSCIVLILNLVVLIPFCLFDEVYQLIYG